MVTITDAEIAVRLDYLKEQYIETIRDDDCRALLDRVLSRAEEIERRTANGTVKLLEGRAELIIGESGSGKSTMLNQGLKKHNAFDGYAAGPFPTINKCPFLITLSVRAPCTLGTFGAEILNAAGYPIVSHKSDARVILPLARDHLRRRGVRILVIDEIHALTRSKSDVELAKLQDLLRSLLTDLVHPVQLIFVGTESALCGLNDEDGQLLRRANIMRLDPFAPSEAPRVEKMVARLARAADVAVGDSRPDQMAARLIHACRGRLGLMIEMTILAIEQALRREVSLTNEQYAHVYARQMAAPASRNPFAAPDFKHIEIVRVSTEVDRKNKRNWSR